MQENQSHHGGRIKFARRDARLKLRRVYPPRLSRAEEDRLFSRSISSLATVGPQHRVPGRRFKGDRTLHTIMLFGATARRAMAVQPRFDTSN
jgi:hypothetical protein